MRPSSVVATPLSERTRLLRWWDAHAGGLALVFCGVLLPLWLFGVIAHSILAHQTFALDVGILRAWHSHASPGLDRFMTAMAIAGSARCIVPFEAAVLALLLKRRRFSDVLFWVLALGGASLINFTAKNIFERTRPALWLSIAPETSYSFPSAHAMQTMALAAALIVLTWPTRWRWPVVAVGSIFAALVGASRVYLGVHYPSDVLGGWAASLAWVLTLSTLIYRHWAKPHPYAVAQQ
ncbi:MAG: phosphatase PAP2 family protein [Pseudomonadota bacterium]|nr:phosphatase PAP2 family protein [Pseudomonadota bacterium]